MVRVENRAFPEAAIHCTFRADAKLGFPGSFHFQMTLAPSPDPSSKVVEVYSRAGKGEVSQEIGWTHLGGFLDDLQHLPQVLEQWVIEILEEMIDE